MFSAYGDIENLEGIYTASDPSMLEIAGTVSDFNIQFIRIEFKPCSNSTEALVCGTDKEIRTYLASKMFMFLG